MVTGDLGVPGGAAPKHVMEQEKDLGAATIRIQEMGGRTVLDQAAHQKFVLAQVNF